MKCKKFISPVLLITGFLLWFYFWPGKVSITNNHGHEFYRGVYNAVNIMYNGRVVMPDNCKIEIEGGKYMIVKHRLYLYSTQNEATLHITDRWGRRLYNGKFYFGQFLIPELAFDGHIPLSGEVLPKRYFDESKGIAVPARLDILDTLRITDYRVTLQMGNETRELRIGGPWITDELREYFHRLKPNDRVTFHHIHFSTIASASNDLYKFFHMTMADAHTGRNDYMLLVRKYEFKDTSRSMYQEDPAESRYHPAIRASEDTLPTFTFTNCHSYSDTCRIEVYAIDGQYSGLSRIYEYLDDDHARIRWYFRGVLLSDISTWHDEWCGPFTLYYRDGRKRMEGNFKLDTQTDTIPNYKSDNDEIKEMNASPLNRYISQATGEWRFYRPEGGMAVRHYKDGEEIK